MPELMHKILEQSDDNTALSMIDIAPVNWAEICAANEPHPQCNVLGDGPNRSVTPAPACRSGIIVGLALAVCCGLLAVALCVLCGPVALVMAMWRGR